MVVLIWLLLAALVVGVPALLLWRRHQKSIAKRAQQRVVDARDTVTDWPPTATRVLTMLERQAYETLLAALPEHMVLAQVPLSRFLRVPTRYSYGEWLSRVGQLSADLVVCDRSSEVLAVVEVRPAQESPRSVQRHQRMTRVLKAAGIRVLDWAEGELPTPAAAREALLPRAQTQTPATVTAAAAIASVAASATRAAQAPAAAAQEAEDLRDPPPTTWFTDLEDTPPPKPPQPR